jgi:membrane fusion protein (multidrug efflux system)
VVQAQGGLTQAAASLTSSRAAIDQGEADVAAAQARYTLAVADSDRAKHLVSGAVISQAQADAAQSELDQSQAMLSEARARLASARANAHGSTGGVVLAQGRLAQAMTGPEQVEAARAAVSLAEARTKQSEAALRLAELDVSFTQIKAPHRGLVSRRTVEAGQMVGPDRPLLAVVPLDDVWVVADFKEDQLRDMRAGEPVDIAVDTFGGRPFRGHVDSLAGASGARFALLPPDNATGNFIKVVQRVPVLIRFDDTAGAELRPGMSATVTVHTGGR